MSWWGSSSHPRGLRRKRSSMPGRFGVRCGRGSLVWLGCGISGERARGARTFEDLCVRRRSWERSACGYGRHLWVERRLLNRVGWRAAVFRVNLCSEWLFGGVEESHVPSAMRVSYLRRKMSYTNFELTVCSLRMRWSNETMVGANDVQQFTLH